jgi:hypothetical protein
MKIKYDDYYDPENSVCSIGDQFNANKTCNLTFVVPRDLQPPVLLYYELDNFHQNHRSYYQSRDDYQLNGRVGNQDKVSRTRCEPLNQLGNFTLNPCGLTANTFFNDYFQLVQGQEANSNIDDDQQQPLILLEDGIAWQSDLEYAFSQPNGFKSEVCPDEFNCSDECCSGDDWSCTTPYIDPKDNFNCYRYYYPEDEKTQYLYETYPDIISPLEGVTNEHFIVWMRVATQVCICGRDYLSLFCCFGCLFARSTSTHANISVLVPMTNKHENTLHAATLSKTLWLDQSTHCGGRRIGLYRACQLCCFTLSRIQGARAHDQQHFWGTQSISGTRVLYRGLFLPRCRDLFYSQAHVSAAEIGRSVLSTLQERLG